MAVAQAVLAAEAPIDAYTPVPRGIDQYNKAICNLCESIGKKLRRVDYTISNVKAMWKRSRQDKESIGIIAELTLLTKDEVAYLLDIDTEKVTKSLVGISDYWVRNPLTKDNKPDDTKPEKELELVYLGKKVNAEKQVRYKFRLNGTFIQLDLKQAIALIRDIPSESRNCYPTFDTDIALKSNYRVKSKGDVDDEEN